MLDGVASVTTDNDVPTAVAAGDTGELIGSISEHDAGTFCCSPADSIELIWTSAADFTADQKAGPQKLEEVAKQEAQAAAEGYEKDIVAAEKCDETAETKLQDCKNEAKAEAESDAKPRKKNKNANVSKSRTKTPQPKHTKPIRTLIRASNIKTAMLPEQQARHLCTVVAMARAHPGCDNDGIGCE